MVKKEYKIKVLEGVAAVRQTAGMYVGDLSNGEGYHHLFYEVLDNSVDEFLAGHCDKIIVNLYDDGSISVEDNGRGIPVYHMKKENKSALEVVLTKLHAGGKFNKDNYAHSSGLHGVGVSLTNFLSSFCTAVVWKDRKEHKLNFIKGERKGKLEIKNVRRGPGTLIHFKPDEEVFSDAIGFNIDIIKKKIKEISYLCNGLTIELNHKDKTEVFYSENGVGAFVKELGKKLIHDVVLIEEEQDGILVNVAFQWEDSISDNINLCYTNNVFNNDGGSHLIGFKNSLTRTINSYISNSDLPKSLQVSLSGDDIREGLIAIVSIRHPNPSFSSQTKDKLVSENARTVVESIVSNKLSEYLEKNPKFAKQLATRCVNSFKAREAAKRAREAVRKSAIKTSAITLPGKLADCSSTDPSVCELFLVEGESAGGSSKMARDRMTQAILPLRGKVLNVEKAEFKKVLSNEELMNVIVALGVGIGRNLNIKKLRYDKIIINTDADVDGSHIRTLLLTFFFRQMPQLISNGNIFVAVPPLYRVNFRGKAYYMKNDKELQEFIKEKKLQRDKIKLQRFKGLGEMNPDQLWETTLNPETRMLLRIDIGNIIQADKIFNILMGNQVEPRKDFIVENVNFTRSLDI